MRGGCRKGFSETEGVCENGPTDKRSNDLLVVEESGSLTKASLRISSSYRERIDILS
jgi:hypothetical protein